MKQHDVFNLNYSAVKQHAQYIVIRYIEFSVRNAMMYLTSFLGNNN